jgi:hypothetical protein
MYMLHLKYMYILFWVLNVVRLLIEEHVMYDKTNDLCCGWSQYVRQLLNELYIC